MTDSLGRSWQLGTVQLDYNMPMRFGLTYTGADNAEHQPVMIHRALMGSYERFIGILIEHYGGELPVWLAPVQAIVLPIADRHIDVRARGRASGSTPPACGPSSTSAPSRSGARSATPSCARSRTCWSWATASRRPSEVALREHRRGDAGSVPRRRVRRSALQAAGENPLEPVEPPLYSVSLIQRVYITHGPAPLDVTPAHRS